MGVERGNGGRQEEGENEVSGRQEGSQRSGGMEGANVLPVGISFALSTTCTEINGICTLPPAPIPVRI